MCDANYVGFTARHLHQRISEHRYSAIGKHIQTQRDRNIVELHAPTHRLLSRAKHLDFSVQTLLKLNSKLKSLILEASLTERENPESLISTVAHNCHIKTKCSQQIKNRSHQIQIAHIKFKSLTANSNRSQQITNH